MAKRAFGLSKFAVVVSLVLHGALLAVLFLGWEPAPVDKKITKPNYVNAKLVKLEAQKQNPAPKKDQPKKIDLTKRKQEQERLLKLEQEKKQAAIKRKQEEQKKREAEDERKRKERERLAREQAEAEAERRQQERERLQAEQEEMQRALAAERTAILEASYQQTAQSYMAAIAERIERNWSRPPSARNNMQCELLIKLVPTGRVISVDVAQSSGNSLFDRSAVQAVKKAEQFPEIREMPNEVFERYYRELTLVFNPQDLRQ